MTPAYKFLAPGAVSPFTGFEWPVTGAWVSAGTEDRASWIFACRERDLPYWVDAELWRVQLDGAVRAAPFQISAARARLVGRVEAWSQALRRRYALACAVRARDLALPALPAGIRAAVSRLDAPAEIAGALRTVPDAPPVAGLLADAAATSGNESPAATSYIACMLAASIGGGQPAFEAERAWQAQWLTQELGLR